MPDDPPPKEPPPQPAGGWEDAPVPSREPGFTVKFTFVKAVNLPIADYGTLSSDPYVLALLTTDLPSRHKDVPATLVFRTPTVQKSVKPVWNASWVVANVPASGFSLKCRVMDEDPQDHDDRLGNAHVNFSSLSENFEPIHEQAYPIEKRSGSWRAYALRAVANAVQHDKRMTGDLYLSIEVLGRTQGEGGKLYTVGPGNWSKHYSPLIGRMVGTQGDSDKKGADGKDIIKFDFEANKVQLAGPVPDDLFHRYVEFKPFVKGMFTKAGVRGHILYKLLRHQHSKIYGHDSLTKYGCVPEPGKALAQKFLEMAHYDQGGRMFTYVLTLDGQLRFTETGKNLGIDLLSKHTMHSDVSQYIACSGEFFVRRLKSPDEAKKDVDDRESHPPKKLDGGPPKEEPTHEPQFYELIIDNDSGTYRPKKEFLPQLQAYLDHNFEGLKVTTMACDDEKLIKLKEQQRHIKETEGDTNIYKQVDDAGSISSSDEEDLRSQDEDEEKKKSVAGKLKQMATDPKATVIDWASQAA